MGTDEALMASISSANMACGFHAGDPSVMRRTVALAKSNGVAVGAHPGFPDLVGFGRRELSASPDEVTDMVLYQVAALAGVAASQGVRLQHVKAHGALYNMAVRSRALADAIANGTAAFDRSLILFGLSGSELLSAGERAGLRVAAEVFADRAYESDGTLVPRTRAWQRDSRPERGRLTRDPNGPRSRGRGHVTDRWCSCGPIRFVCMAIRRVRPIWPARSDGGWRPLASPWGRY